MPAVTKQYRTLDTPPIHCDQTVKAETIIAAVVICLLGLAQIYLGSA